jgi:hypothetical protein
MDYIVGIFGYFSGSKVIINDETICNLEVSLTPQCLNDPPDNKFIRDTIDSKK